MNTKIAGLAVAAALMAAPLAARAQVSIGVAIAPPAPRYERPPPPPHPGYVWAPGHWRYSGGKYAWNGGHYMAPRPGYRWTPDTWRRTGAATTTSPGTG